jgi:hypothetical protein
VPLLSICEPLAEAVKRTACALPETDSAPVNATVSVSPVTPLMMMREVCVWPAPTVKTVID